MLMVSLDACGSAASAGVSASRCFGGSGTANVIGDEDPSEIKLVHDPLSSHRPNKPFSLGRRFSSSILDNAPWDPEDKNRGTGERRKEASEDKLATDKLVRTILLLGSGWLKSTLEILGNGELCAFRCRDLLCTGFNGVCPNVRASLFILFS